VQELDFGSGPVIGTTDPVTSDIKVRMTLADIEFDLLKRIDMDWGIGVGLGQVGLDITMTPEVGDSVDISGDVPFGYLTSTFTKRWDRIEFRFGLQGLSISENETSVAYKSANIAGSYRILKRKRLGLDIAVGYRYVNFDYDFDDDATGARAGTDFTLVGPYGGLGVAW